MNRPFVSITVPIYNAEKYLYHCIDSLINQTLKNIEIILIDDGSTDRSGEICDEYFFKDDRIKVIHQQNGGSAAARQCGLECSTGMYYTVCDSDDWIESTMYEELYLMAIKSNADIVDSRIFSNYPDGKELKSEAYTYISQEQYIEDLMTRKTNVCTCSKLFRLDFIRELGVNYELGINLGEDALFLLKILQFPTQILVTDKTFYHYRREMGSNSITSKISLKLVKDEEYVHKWKMSAYTLKRYDKAHLLSLVNLAFVALRAPDVSEAYYHHIIKNLYLHNLLKCRIFNAKAILIGSTKIFGLGFGKFLLNILYRYYYK